MYTLGIIAPLCTLMILTDAFVIFMCCFPVVVIDVHMRDKDVQYYSR